MLHRFTRGLKFAVLTACLLYVVAAIYMQNKLSLTASAAFAGQAQTKSGAARGEAGKEGAAKVRELWWKTMRGFDYRKGTVNAELKTYDGTRVKIPGFMVPLEDDAEKVREFLLVPYAGACIHVPPPPPNQIVLVRMAPGKSAAMDWYNPVWVEGVFRISKAGSIYGDAAFTLAGQKAEEYREEPGR